ncbi:MAG: O-antigen ligase family protein [Bacteroidia bacterium]
MATETFTTFTDKRKKIADVIYSAGLFLLVTGLPLSMFLMSVSQFVLIGSWLIDGDYKNKLRRFFTNKVCLSLCAFYVIHLVGLFYTTDFDYAMRDLRIKLPLVILPLIIFTSTPLSFQKFIMVMKVFVLACLISSLISTGVWLQLIHVHKPINDIRDISIFISHIRLSLLICIAMFACGYFVLILDKNILTKAIHIALIAWFIIFLIILQSLTGLIVGSIALIALAIQYLMNQRKYALVLMIGLFLSGGFYLLYNYTNKQIKSLRTEELVDLTNLPKTTSRGNLYQHELKAGDLENGHRIYLFVCESELREEWNKRSKISFDSLDKRKQYVMYTLIRYMTSKGLRKDADGMMQLTAQDITYVENGIGSINEFTQTGIEERIESTIWELNNYIEGGDPGGHTLSMRFEFWKASVSIIKQNLLFGVGTGDNQLVLNNYYETHHTRLSKQWWLRSHNQFLAIGISFGLVGVTLFLLSHLYPVTKLKMYSDYFYFTFFVIAMLSFLTEDTLETQAGVTFFAFFNSFFLFSRTPPPKNNKDL